MTGIFIKKNGKFGQGGGHTRKKDSAETQGEESYPQCKERGLEQPAFPHRPQKELTLSTS